MDTDSGGSRYVAGQLIVTYEEGAPEAVSQELPQSVEASVEREFELIDAQLVEFPEVMQESAEAERERLLAERKRELENDPAVESVDYNYIRKLTATPNDPLFGRQWHLPRIAAPRAWSTGNGDPQTRISVIDSGIALNHPDLASKVSAAADCTVPDTADPFQRTCAEGAGATDSRGHGTHVAGIAAAATNNNVGVAGTCPECSLLVAKAESGGGLEVAAILAAIEWSVNEDADVINMSFGDTRPVDAEENALNRAWNRGVTLVASAGNDSTSVRQYPAAYENVIAVAATTPQDTRAGYSSFGPWVDVAAPGGVNTAGGAVYSTVPGGYGNKIGTSMASPVVAGVAGLLASQGLDNVQTRQRIQATAVDLGPSGKDALFGHGRVNAAAAVGAPANARPRIGNLAPRPASRLRTNTVTIRATVSDRETDLRRKDIRLVVNGRLVNFNYNAASDRLVRQMRLPAGRHRVRVLATDEEGLRTAATWGFSTSAPARRAAPQRPGESVSQNVSINQSRSSIGQAR